MGLLPGGGGDDCLRSPSCQQRQGDLERVADPEQAAAAGGVSAGGVAERVACLGQRQPAIPPTPGFGRPGPQGVARLEGRVGEVFRLQ